MRGPAVRSGPAHWPTALGNPPKPCLLPPPPASLYAEHPASWSDRKTETLRELLKAATTTRSHPQGPALLAATRALAPPAPWTPAPPQCSRTLRPVGPAHSCVTVPLQTPSRWARCDDSTACGPATHSYPDSPFPSKPKSAYNPFPLPFSPEPKAAFLLKKTSVWGTTLPSGAVPFLALI